MKRCGCRIPFESNPPIANPPLDTYWRRAIYELALHRLGDIVEAIKGFDTSHTGKVYRDEQGEAIGRGRGILPSLKKQFKELRWDKSPAELRRTITQAKTPAYFQLLERAIAAVENESGEQLELFVKRAPKAQLREIPPVVYPAHQGKRSCRHCRRPHSSTLHRFHLRGSFAKTHSGRRDRRRITDEVPF